MKNAEIIKIAELLQSRMLDHGIVVQRYNAYSTNSIYLKLDYGVCNSIRISDHKGKKHLKYRYNIGPFIKKIERKMDKFDRFYYPAVKIDSLVKKILSDRAEKLDKYGDEKYRDFMKKNKMENADKKGFWKSAYVVE
ncbi:MAG: hypothetical protein H2212_00070 [Ruminococcus sp.]|nr:hypothetical protein [Ruminococcus sp.]